MAARSSAGPGGIPRFTLEFRLVSRGPDGNDHSIRGLYREIARLADLVATLS